MGDRDGRMRLYWRHVSFVRRVAGNRPAPSGRCLYFGLSAAPGGVACRPDEIAGENFSRTLVPKSETRTGSEARRSALMTSMLSSRAKSRDPVAGPLSFAAGFFDSPSLRSE